MLQKHCRKCIAFQFARVFHIAQKAKIDDYNKILSLIDEVNFYAKGMQFTTKQLEINLLDKQIIAKDKISANYNNSLVKADNLFIDANNNIIKLRGNVKAKISFSDF